MVEGAPSPTSADFLSQISGDPSKGTADLKMRKIGDSLINQNFQELLNSIAFIRQFSIEGPLAIEVQEFVPSGNGQTVFPFPEEFKSGGFNLLFVNNSHYRNPLHYVITTDDITWQDVGFTLDTQDNLVLFYERVPDLV